MLWFNFILGSNFLFFFLGMVVYDNNMILSLKQKKRKFEPRIKLNHNIYVLGGRVISQRTYIYVLGRHWVKNHTRFSRTTYNVQLYQKCNFTECTKMHLPSPC